MNRRLLAPALALLLGTASCSEDFDVVAPAKPITVVYGVLTSNDSLNYVRIQKAFADPNRSALDLAKLPDSSYYQNLTVSLVELDGANARTVIAAAPRVDLALRGYSKESGTFFTTPSYAYELAYRLNPARRYRLRILNNETGNVDSAETNVIDPSVLNIYELNTVTNANQTFILPTAASNREYTWRIINTAPANVRVLEPTLRFRYVDVPASGGATTSHSFEFRFTQVLKNPSGSFTTTFPSISRADLLQAIAGGMGAAPQGVTRLIDSVDFLAYAGNDTLYTFQQNQSALGGLTSDQIQYRYTNIRGKDALGVLANRAVLTRLQVPIDAGSLRELQNDPATAPAKITGVTLD